MRTDRVLLHSFPRSWRNEHGEALMATLADLAEEQAPWVSSLDLLRAGLGERFHRCHQLVSRNERLGAEIVQLRRGAASDRLRRHPVRWRVVLAVAPILLVAAIAVPFALRLSSTANTPAASVPAAYGPTALPRYAVVEMAMLPGGAACAVAIRSGSGGLNFKSVQVDARYTSPPKVDRDVVPLGANAATVPRCIVTAHSATYAAYKGSA